MFRFVLFCLFCFVLTGIYTANWTATNTNTASTKNSDHNHLQNAQYVNVTNCIINNHGNNGIDIVGTNIYLSNNDISYVGCMGLSIQGGDYKTLTSSNNKISYNTIYSFARWKRTYQSGLFWNGVGNIFSFNNVTFGPHNGILGGGNEILGIESTHPFGGCTNIFEYNYIGNTTFETSDSGSFYTCGQSNQGWNNRGNIIRHNTFENIRNLVKCPLGGVSVNTIYLDDQMSGYLIENNTFINCQNAMFVGGGRRNILMYNYCFDVDTCAHLDNRGMSWQNTDCNYPNGSLWEGLYYVNYTYPPWSIQFPELLKIENQEPCVPVFNQFENNQYCNTGKFSDFSNATAVSWNSTLKNNVEHCK